MNDYHAAFERMCENESYKGQQWFGKRQYLVERFGWAIPNDDVLSYISDTFESIVEVGAGDGYWANLLSSRGVDVSAYDKNSFSKHYDVTHQDARQLESTINNSPLLMVWPPVNDNLAAHMVSFWPSHVLYVGEQRGGCTANDKFFDLIDQYYGLVEQIDIPSYEGVHDNFYHYVRKV